MGKIVRITLDVSLRPLTDKELAVCGVDQLPEGCRPNGTDADLEEIAPEELANLISFALDGADDMWGGSDLYAAVDKIAIVSAKDLPA